MRSAEGDAGALHRLGVLGFDARADAFARAATYTLPARYEPFGQSVLEAGLAGCALVLGDIPTLRELWDSAALFVPPDDPTGLRAALTDLIRNPRLRRELGADARRRGLEYSSERMARGYLAVYDRLRSPACAS
jgi:glycosyltransferase involved in cell wall biosynthesis